MAEPLLHVTGIEKSLGGESILRGVDFDVEPGHIVVIVGPNGAGKTVLLCCIAGGLDPDSGSVEIEGTAADHRSRRLLSFLPQHSMAIEHLTGRENARFYTKLHPAGANRWPALADGLGISNDLGAKVRTYSGGMKRKLELAIALDPDVPLFLLDEPTAGVDLSKAGRLHDLLRSRASAGQSVVLTSHTPLDMELADRIVVVRDGRFRTIGRPADLLEALPAILRVRGRVAGMTGIVADYVIGGRWTVRGDELRGFLRPDVDPDRIERRLGRESRMIDVGVESPSFVDLFNYHTDPALEHAVDANQAVAAK